jgi:hypothetical protein
MAEGQGVVRSPGVDAVDGDGVEDMIYMSSSSANDGSYSLSVTFYQSIIHIKHQNTGLRVQLSYNFSPRCYPKTVAKSASPAFMGAPLRRRKIHVGHRAAVVHGQHLTSYARF